MVPRLQRDSRRDVGAGLVAADDQQRPPAAEPGALLCEGREDRKADLERLWKDAAKRCVVVRHHDDGPRGRQTSRQRAFFETGAHEGAAIKIQQNRRALDAVSALIDLRRDAAQGHVLQYDVLHVDGHGAGILD